MSNIPLDKCHAGKAGNEKANLLVKQPLLENTDPHYITTPVPYTNLSNINFSSKLMHDWMIDKHIRTPWIKVRHTYSFLNSVDTAVKYTDIVALRFITDYHGSFRRFLYEINRSSSSSFYENCPFIPNYFKLTLSILVIKKIFCLCVCLFVDLSRKLLLLLSYVL